MSFTHLAYTHTHTHSHVTSAGIVPTAVSICPGHHCLCPHMVPVSKQPCFSYNLASKIKLTTPCGAQGRTHTSSRREENPLHTSTNRRRVSRGTAPRATHCATQPELQTLQFSSPASSEQCCPVEPGKTSTRFRLCCRPSSLSGTKGRRAAFLGNGSWGG